MWHWSKDPSDVREQQGRYPREDSVRLLLWYAKTARWIFIIFGWNLTWTDLKCRLYEE